MKNLALVIAFVFLAVVSASAAEISQAAPAAPATSAAAGTPATPALEPLVGTPAPLFMGPHQILPYCHTLQGLSCTGAGVTTACTDVCNNHLSCTCYAVYAPPYYVTIVGYNLYCEYEC